MARTINLKRTNATLSSDSRAVKVATLALLESLLSELDNLSKTLVSAVADMLPIKPDAVRRNTAKPRKPNR